MARVLTLAKTFPKYHPRCGEPTGFREAYLNQTKLHTIRFGIHHDEERDIRQWSGMPYRSKQEKIEKVEVSNFHIKVSFDGVTLKLWSKNYTFFELSRIEANWKLIDSQSLLFATNDGLSVIDFIDWFVPYGKTAPFEKDATIIVWDAQCAKAYARKLANAAKIEALR